TRKSRRNLFASLALRVNIQDSLRNFKTHASGCKNARFPQKLVLREMNCTVGPVPQTSYI
ncbi:MAG TPA: hypothetical protein PLY87_26815, partial [Planctomycetaceae bacterium]|nr:hypothetical protein [Planctomycetaceae bacterium]